MDFPHTTELKKMKIDELKIMGERIRQFLIETVSKTGGHIGANLGVIELSIALHYVFDSSQDRIIFDTGHQGYTHKILTGRTNLFSTLNKFRGMNRFLTRSESPYDIIDATHGGTSISTASGIAQALKSNNSPNLVVAIIGDGSLVEGTAFEGLNFLAGTDLRCIIVINDNGMAIAPNVGGIKNLTEGMDWQVKCRFFFQSLGFLYLAIPDGHDISKLVSGFQKAKKMIENKNQPLIIHVKTEKGKGLPYAKNHPYKMHFSLPFEPKTGKGASPTISGKTYALIAAEEIQKILKKDEDIHVITPATPYASSLDSCLKEFPDRVYDVGMAEQHAVSMACGLALAGKKPVVCFQTTFMQRAFDQLLHDLSFMNLPVTILGVRSGFAGYDGPTHHGLYDIPYLRSFPNMQIVYPINSSDLRLTISERLMSPHGPMVILYPYEEIPDPEPIAGKKEYGLSLIDEKTDGMIFCLGNKLDEAIKTKNILKDKYQIDFGLVCVSNIKPLPVERILDICTSTERVITLEESTLPGGFGSLICETLFDNSLFKQVLRLGVLDKFVPAGNKNECNNECGLEPGQIVEQILKHWPELKK